MMSCTYCFWTSTSLRLPRRVLWPPIKTSKLNVSATSAPLIQPATSSDNCESPERHPTGEDRVDDHQDSFAGCIDPDVSLLVNVVVVAQLEPFSADVEMQVFLEGLMWRRATRVVSLAPGFPSCACGR